MPQDAPSYCKFLRKPCKHPWWPNLEKEAMAASIGMQWSHGATILIKFELLNVISDQLMDCNVIIDHYRHIAVHKLDIHSFLDPPTP